MLSVATAAGVALPVSALAASSTVKPTVLIEQTFLKALPGLRQDLAEFITKNWFAMDQEGVKQGIFTSYWLMEDIDENKDWDLVVSVGYPQPGGYEEAETKAKFMAIRSAHKEIKINDRGLKDIGSVVKHHRLKLSGGNTSITTLR
jgi:hypothetical protein